MNQTKAPLTDMVTVHVRLKRDTHRRFRFLCSVQGVSLREAVERLVERELHAQSPTIVLGLEQFKPEGTPTP